MPDNSSSVNGNNNIVIQGVSDSKITLNINGDTKEIDNKLSEIKELLSQLNEKSFTINNQDFSVDEISEENFGFVTGTKTFNEELTKRLIDALKPHSPLAQNFHNKVSNLGGDWQKNNNIRNVAKEVISCAYVGILGIEIRKIMAIGKEEHNERKLKNYLDHCVTLTFRILQLIGFSLISDLWNHTKSETITINDKAKNTIAKFFTDTFGPGISHYTEILTSVANVFKENKIHSPIPELIADEFQGVLKEDSQLLIAFNNMDKIRNSLADNSYSLLTCFAAEKNLTYILEKFAFLAAYNMVSIKKINYEEMRNSSPLYLHSYASLGIDTKKRINAEKIDSMEKPTGTEAILLYKDNFLESINLFPFIIDINALRSENGSKICFYQMRDINDNSLNYQFVEDNSQENISESEVLSEEMSIAEILNDKKTRTIMMQNFVVQNFNAAQEAIIGKQESAAGFSLEDLT